MPDCEQTSTLVARLSSALQGRRAHAIYPLSAGGISTQSIPDFMMPYRIIGALSLVKTIAR